MHIKRICLFVVDKEAGKPDGRFDTNHPFVRSKC